MLLLGFTQVSGAVENYLKMSQDELNKALIVAVKQGSCDEVQKLIQVGADIDTPISYTYTSGDCDWNIESTALVYAVRQNCPHMVKVLIEVDKKALNNVLREAIEEGYSDVVKELIKGGADSNCVYNDTDTPLMVAVKHARATAKFSSQANERYSSRCYERQEIIQTLLQSGANVTYVNKNGRTVLMEAVIKHDLTTVQSLLQIPAMTTGSYFGFGTKPINYADEKGNTALILAMKYVRYTYIVGDSYEYNICLSSQNIINALLQTPGIDCYHVNENGDTAIALFEKIDKDVQRYW